MPAAELAKIDEKTSPTADHSPSGHRRFGRLLLHDNRNPNSHDKNSEETVPTERSPRYSNHDTDNNAVTQSETVQNGDQPGSSGEVKSGERTPTNGSVGNIASKIPVKITHQGSTVNSDADKKTVETGRGGEESNSSESVTQGLDISKGPINAVAEANAVYNDSTEKAAEGINSRGDGTGAKSQGHSESVSPSVQTGKGTPRQSAAALLLHKHTGDDRTKRASDTINLPQTSSNGNFSSPKHGTNDAVAAPPNSVNDVSQSSVHDPLEQQSTGQNQLSDKEPGQKAANAETSTPKSTNSATADTPRKRNNKVSPIKDASVVIADVHKDVNGQNGTTKTDTQTVSGGPERQSDSNSSSDKVQDLVLDPENGSSPLVLHVKPSQQSPDTAVRMDDTENQSKQKTEQIVGQATVQPTETPGSTAGDENTNQSEGVSGQKSKPAGKSKETGGNKKATPEKAEKKPHGKLKSSASSASLASQESGASTKKGGFLRKPARILSGKLTQGRRGKQADTKTAQNKDSDTKKQRVSSANARSPRRPDSKTKANDNSSNGMESNKPGDDKNKKDTVTSKTDTGRSIKTEKTNNDSKPANGSVPKGVKGNVNQEKKSESDKEEESKKKAQALLSKAIMKRVASMDSNTSSRSLDPQQLGDSEPQWSKTSGQKSGSRASTPTTPVPGQGRRAHKTQSMQSLHVPNGPVPREGEAEDAVSIGSRRDSMRQSMDSMSRKSVDYRLQAAQAVVNVGQEEKPKSVMVHDDSMIRAAIPALPVPLAVLCLVCNILIPGLGTVISGFSVLCCGKPRLSTKGDSVIISMCVNVWVGAAQLGTVTFLLVGWFWSLAWGIKMVILAVEHRAEQRKEREKELQTLALRAFGSPGQNHHSILPV